MTICLDSWAVLTWLDGDEPASVRVEQVFEDQPVMSWVNAVEVYYRIERDHGRDEADEVLSELRGMVAMDLPGTSLMVESARLKARYAMVLGRLLRRRHGHQPPRRAADG